MMDRHLEEGKEQQEQHPHQEHSFPEPQNAEHADSNCPSIDPLKAVGGSQGKSHVPPSWCHDHSEWSARRQTRLHADGQTSGRRTVAQICHLSCGALDVLPLVFDKKKSCWQTLCNEFNTSVAKMNVVSRLAQERCFQLTNDISSPQNRQTTRGESSKDHLKKKLSNSDVSPLELLLLHANLKVVSIKLPCEKLHV